jgi:hypothetical protein
VRVCIYIYMYIGGFNTVVPSTYNSYLPVKYYYYYYYYYY